MNLAQFPYPSMRSGHIPAQVAFYCAIPSVNDATRQLIVSTGDKDVFVVIRKLVEAVKAQDG